MKTETSANLTFNTDVSLWKNYRAAYPSEQLTIRQGHIVSQGNGVIGRFDTSDEAAQALTAAGYSGQDFIKL
jgi:hypothetical protein